MSTALGGIPILSLSPVQSLLYCDCCWKTGSARNLITRCFYSFYSRRSELVRESIPLQLNVYILDYFCLKSGQREQRY